MRITRIETIAVRIPYTCGGPLPTMMGRIWSTLDTLLVKVETDEGLIGWGEAFGHHALPATQTALDDLVAPLLIGRDPGPIDAIAGELQQKLHNFGRGGPVTYAISGAEIALWDLAGKAAGLPLHRLLGGTTLTHLDAYASLLRYTEPALVAKNVNAALERGYRHVKLHETDTPQVKAARDAAGDDIPLMVDMNCPWSVPRARDMARALTPYRLAWLEEPVWPPENHAGLADVRHEGIAIAAGENASSAFEFAQLFEASSLDIAQPSVTKVGGVGEVRMVIALAQAANVRVIPHCAYFGPGFLASLHLASTLSEEPPFERLYVDLEADLFGDLCTPVQGRLRIPDGHGLGCDPDPKVIERYALRKPGS